MQHLQVRRPQAGRAGSQLSQACQAVWISLTCPRQIQASHTQHHHLLYALESCPCLYITPVRHQTPTGCICVQAEQTPNNVRENAVTSRPTHNSCKQSPEHGTHLLPPLLSHAPASSEHWACWPGNRYITKPPRLHTQVPPSRVMQVAAVMHQPYERCGQPRQVHHWQPFA
jgi:hypothetical protein